jgi:chorismate synthase
MTPDLILSYLNPQLNRWQQVFSATTFADMNTFGQLFRCTVLGESHGPHIGIVIDGVPHGLPLEVSDFAHDINRRRPGQAGTTPRAETDIPILTSGVFNGHTTGAPLCLLFENSNTVSKDYAAVRATPRPGHADFVASRKFDGFEDYRGGGHFSGRLTVLLVAAGVIAKKLLKNVQITAKLTEIAGNQDIDAAIAQAVANQDSVGGIIECTVNDLPIGLGEPFFNSIESVLAHGLFSIPAVKGVEFGAGFAATRMTGSQHNDALLDQSGRTKTNHAGGIVGGLTNGNPLVFRVAVKPTSSTPKEQETLNIVTDQIEKFVVKGRHDLCIALRVPVVVEAVTALVLADMVLLEGGKF